jgi:Fatty acid desaturase
MHPDISRLPTPLWLPVKLLSWTGLILCTAINIAALGFIVLTQLLVWPLTFALKRYPALSRPLRGCFEALTRVGSRIAQDPRDGMVFAMTVMITPVLLGYVLWAYLTPDFGVIAVLAYYAALLHGPDSMLAINVYKLKHTDVHAYKGLYKKPYGYFLDHIYEYVLSPLYGVLPEIDRWGHAGVHHYENSGPDDNVGVRRYDRTSLLDFFRYLFYNAAWHTSGLGVLYYFHARKRPKLLRKALWGMLFYYSVVGFLLFWMPRPTFWFLVVPYFANWFWQGILDWTWHIFANPEEPDNVRTATITVIDRSDDFWGDFVRENYHLSHHIKQSLHWTEWKPFYEQNPALFVDSTTFRGLDLFEIFYWTTVRGRVEPLAEKYVDQTGAMSKEQIAERLYRWARP